MAVGVGVNVSMGVGVKVGKGVLDIVASGVPVGTVFDVEKRHKGPTAIAP